MECQVTLDVVDYLPSYPRLVCSPYLPESGVNAEKIANKTTSQTTIEPIEQLE